MANIPQKSTDPTEAALSAIQEALKSNESGRPSPPGETTPAGTGAPLALPDDLFESEPQLRPANDDRAAIGQILQTLRRRPARTPYIVAALAAALWIAGGLSTAYLFRAELLSLYASPRAGVAAGRRRWLPPFWCRRFSSSCSPTWCAARRTCASSPSSMAEVAMHLSQPEAEGRDAVVTVGQAVRREVAAMGDGIERALARAGELEVLVHNEVSALERAYSDNEVRIRDLLRELTSQRETLVTQAEQVRNAISSVHLDLAHDITSVGDLVADKVNDVAQRVTRSLTEKGEHITLALGHAGDSMIDALGERGSTLLERLETTSDKATTAITAASERLTDSLTFKTEHIHDEFADMAARLQQMMTARLDQVAQGFAAAHQPDHRADGGALAVAHRGDHPTPAPAWPKASRPAPKRPTPTLRSTGQALVADLSLRSGEVVGKMDETGRAHQPKRWPRAATSSPTISARAPRRWSPPSTTAAKRSKTCWRSA